MATFHVIYDPNERLRLPSPDECRSLKVSHVTLRVDAVTPDDPEADAAIARQLAELLLKNMTA
jgi:hypothetical protein